MDLKGSKTEQNLQKALSIEALAKCFYAFYADQARIEGYQQIANIFDETDVHETAHARIWYERLYGKIQNTESNLQKSAELEHEASTDVYPEFAKTALEEGFNEIAFQMKMTALIEKFHEERFLKLLSNMKNNTVFNSADGKDIAWICMNCGYIHIGESAPEACPVCRYPKGYFERKATNY